MQVSGLSADFPSVGRVIAVPRGVQLRVVPRNGR